ncbi:MAG TPA: hypothetical protein PLD55_13725 [bacterium]|nr:hypothetical protein [bacterium]
MTDKKQNAIKDVFENASEYAKHYDPSQFLGVSSFLCTFPLAI